MILLDWGQTRIVQVRREKLVVPDSQTVHQQAGTAHHGHDGQLVGCLPPPGSAGFEMCPAGMEQLVRLSFMDGTDIGQGKI